MHLPPRVWLTRVCLLQNKVRVDTHAYNSDYIAIQDFTTQTVTTIMPQNTSYPNGLCEVRLYLSIWLAGWSRATPCR
jgi:hypothetical protein